LRRHRCLGLGGVVGLALPLIVVGVVAAAIILIPFHEFSEGEVTSAIRSWGSWGVTGSIGLMILHSIIPFPAEVLALANGMVYGPIWGALVTWIGAMLGALISFGLAKLLGRPIVCKLIPSRHWAKLDELSAREEAAATLLLVRFVPVIAFNLVNYAAGLANVRLWTFLWTTGLGILPLTVLTALAGAQVIDLPWWAWILIVLVCLAIWLIWRSARRS